MEEEDWTDICDYSISDKTVIRISRKVNEGNTYLDIRKMGVDRKGNLFRTRKGLCMTDKFWAGAISKFTENRYLLPVPITNS